MEFQGFVFGETYSRDACASYLADHLDDALALIDRLAACKLGPHQQTITDDVEHNGEWIMGGDAIVSRFAEIRTYVQELKTLELSLTTRLSQARVWAERVQRYDPRLDRVAGLMLSGTHALVDAGARQADTTEEDFNDSDPALGYLRSRGLIGEDVVSLDQVGKIVAGYNFQIWGGVPIYDIAEMMNAFLSAADVHYSLYVPDEETIAEVEAVAAEENADDTAIEETVLVTEDDATDAIEASAEDDVEEDEVETGTAHGEDDANSLAEPVHVMGAITSDAKSDPVKTS